MKVKGSFKTHTEVEIDTVDAFRALRNEVLRDAGIPPDAYIDENNCLVRDEEYHTSHSWFEKIVIDKRPSQNKLYLIRAFKTIAAELDRKLYGKDTYVV